MVNLLDTPELQTVCQKNDVAMLGVFGSVARGEDTQQSDLDLLVSFSKRKSLLALIHFERELSDIVGRKVDLLTESAISPYIRDNILADLLVIYEAG